MQTKFTDLSDSQRQHIKKYLDFHRPRQLDLRDVFNGILDIILRDLVKLERVRQGRNPQPSAAAVDSQSVKVVAFVGQETGVDGGVQRRHRID